MCKPAECTPLLGQLLVLQLLLELSLLLLLVPPLPLPPLLLTLRAQVAERALDAVLATLGVQECTWPASALEMAARANRRECRGA